MDLDGGAYAVISAVVAAIVTVISAWMSHRQSARRDLSADERDLRLALMEEVKRLTQELQDAHDLIRQLQTDKHEKLS